MDVKTARKVVVIGYAIAKKLYPSSIRSGRRSASTTGSTR